MFNGFINSFGRFAPEIQEIKKDNKTFVLFGFVKE